MMNVLIIGAGGREHAIGLTIARSNPSVTLFFAPGNAGTAEIGENIPLNVTELIALKTFAEEKKVYLTIVGPELPLSLGIVDLFKQHGIPIFGPSQAAAQLESSKAFSKCFMRRYGIPTADYHIFSDIQHAKTYLSKAIYPLVIKADGLAAGKGVLICSTPIEAETALIQMMDKKQFGAGGERVIIESFLTGQELSILCFTDGKSIIPMPSAQDYKRALDNDMGLNTGGMGSISPAHNPIDHSINDIIQKTLLGIQQQQFDYTGVIYIGVMLTATGPYVLEYNVRFGDPETQALLPRLNSNLLTILVQITQQKLAEVPIDWRSEQAISVVIAAEGYPEQYDTGHPITLPPTPANVTVFHSGTQHQNGTLVSAGGRVLSISALGSTLEEARQRCYSYIEQIQFKPSVYRRDIGKKINKGQTIQKIYSGKTKDVYAKSDGNIRLFFKDDVTGTDGVFDAGANQVGLTIEGAGYYGVAMSTYFFQLLNKAGIPTHYVSSDLKTNSMDVKKIHFLGQGLEVIYRKFATGSFIRRYGAYCQEGQPLNDYIEFSLKDDVRGDPFISQPLLAHFNILTIDECTQIKQLSIQIAQLIQQELQKKGLTLYDLKLEFGKDEQGNLLLIDEVSAGNMRVYSGSQRLDPITLAQRIVGASPVC